MEEKKEMKLCIICKDKGLLGRNWFVSEKNPCKHCGNTNEKLWFFEHLKN